MRGFKESSSKRLRLLSYNIQGGIATQAYHHYIMKSWQHFLPHQHKRENLDKVADIIGHYDIVALQETDAGSFRSKFINQTEYLAKKAHFPFWFDQVNRNMGKLAQHSNGLLCRYKPVNVSQHKLPGLIPGRGALMIKINVAGHDISIISVHLALGRKTRMKQVKFLSEMIENETSAILMGDLNCELNSAEMEYLFSKTNLEKPKHQLLTFPSWRPKRNIDHIITTHGINVIDINVLQRGVSDHLPVSIEIELTNKNVKH